MYGDERDELDDRHRFDAVRPEPEMYESEECRCGHHYLDHVSGTFHCHFCGCNGFTGKVEWR